MFAGHRNTYKSAIALAIVYFVLAAAAIKLTRFHGGVAFIRSLTPRCSHGS